ncbi:hypothetical protein GGR57DRAFT_419473 [Xylariaceae sp. FL1272]|nr:hypothetical protein GGR57DRAFT_419473 [Xylariaceae sp. FL1272]
MSQAFARQVGDWRWSLSSAQHKTSPGYRHDCYVNHKSRCLIPSCRRDQFGVIPAFAYREYMDFHLMHVAPSSRWRYVAGLRPHTGPVDHKCDNILLKDKFQLQLHSTISHHAARIRGCSGRYCQISSGTQSNHVTVSAHAELQNAMLHFLGIDYMFEQSRRWEHLLLSNAVAVTGQFSSKFEFSIQQVPKTLPTPRSYLT